MRSGDDQRQRGLVEGGHERRPIQWRGDRVDVVGSCALRVVSPATPSAFWSIALPEFVFVVTVPGVMVSDQLWYVVVLPHPEFRISSVQVPLIDSPFNSANACAGCNEPVNGAAHLRDRRPAGANRRRSCP